MSFKKLEKGFTSGGLRCAGWLYSPEGVERPPVVVMAHGFGAEAAFRLPDFAEKFVAEGMAAFLFDYRNFGESEGEPRNLVSPGRHLRDWKAAVRHVRGMSEVNADKMALWGTSFSGGHAITIASKDHGISAVVAQIPHVDGAGSIRNIRPAVAARLAFAGLRDAVRMITFREPYYIKIVGEPHELAALNTPGCNEGYLALVPENTGWRNRCPARITLTVGAYRPIAVARKVKCPALIIMAEQDQLIPPRLVEKTAEKMPNATLVRLPMDHFAPYSGREFEEVSAIETDFLKKHLLNK